MTCIPPVEVATLPLTMRRRVHSHLVAILLVLLHVLGPGLHALAHRCNPGGGVSAAGGEAGAATAQRSSRAAGARGQQTVAAHWTTGDECALCGQLQRDHGFVPVDALPQNQTLPIAAAARWSPPAVARELRRTLPPARGPPLLS